MHGRKRPFTEINSSAPSTEIYDHISPCAPYTVAVYSILQKDMAASEYEFNEQKVFVLIYFILFYFPLL
jgi:hypothetical protein